MNNATKSFDILATGLDNLHNYFDGSTKLFLLSKFISTIKVKFLIFQENRLSHLHIYNVLRKLLLFASLLSRRFISKTDRVPMVFFIHFDKIRIKEM